MRHHALANLPGRVRRPVGALRRRRLERLRQRFSHFLEFIVGDVYPKLSSGL